MNLAQTGRFLTQMRNALGLTQAQLAQRLDVTDKAVSKWERGKSLPDITLLNRLAAELRVSVVEILSGESLNMGRSSNLDEAPSQGDGIDQAGELTALAEQGGFSCRVLRDLGERDRVAILNRLRIH